MKKNQPKIMPLAMTATLCMMLTACVANEKPTGSAEQPRTAYTERIDARIADYLETIRTNQLPVARSGKNDDPTLALTLLYLNKDIDLANQMVVAYCKSGRNVRNSYPLFRIYILDATRRLLTPAAKEAIEDTAHGLLARNNHDVSFAYTKQSYWEIQRGENGFMGGKLPPFLMVLKIVKMSDKYGPKTMVEGVPVAGQFDAWQGFLKRYFRERAVNGSTDLEVAHPSTYAAVTMRGCYDYYDLAESEELKRLVGNFLTLYWAEAVAEFEPKTGQRGGWAATRNSNYDGSRVRWEQPLLYLYDWHDIAREQSVWNLVSGYRPPEILRAIARDKQRGGYLATSRRMGMLVGENQLVGLDENGNSYLRRDVYYTPDYTLATLTYDPTRDYRNEIDLNQTMGVTFACDPHMRITVMGLGYYPKRAINGITGRAISIIARDPKAAFGVGRFKSNGTRVFISKGALWDNRVKDPSGWFFTRAGDAFVGIRIPGQGYQISTKTSVWPDRQLKEVEENNGRHLVLNDMWTPIVIQMGRAADYKNFQAFCDSVKHNQFTYDSGKLTYTSEASDRYEYWANGAQPPKINGQTVNLNPPKTYDSPFLSMEHGSNKAVLRYPAYPDLVLEF